MLTPEARQNLEKQHYRIIGEHSAVKTCGWTKSMIKGEGGCYKLKFYGIMSSQCMQMTTSISCANRCTFCWRDYKAPVAKEWKWNVDDPELILEESKKAHHHLLNGVKSNAITKAAYEGSKTIKHVALSLTGEPITYPRINELIDRFHKQSISTFLVTNAQYPEQIQNLKPITQLYCSVDAPTKQLLKQIDVPLFKDYWERLNQSLEYLAQKNQRTCIRLTLVKGMNMEDHEHYAELIKKGNPDFIEVKAYIYIGASRERLEATNMPRHEEVVRFTQELMQYLPDYDIVTDHFPSRVVMCAKKKFKHADGWYTWIDFPKFMTLVQSGGEFTTEDYLRKTPKVGLTDLKKIEEEQQKEREKKTYLKVNETTEEAEIAEEDE